MTTVPSLIQEVELSKFDGPKNASQQLQEIWLPRLQSFRDLLFSNKAQSENVWAHSTVTEALMSSNALDLLGAAERLLDLRDSVITQDVNLLHNQSLSRMLSSSSLWFDHVVESSI